MLQLYCSRPLALGKPLANLKLEPYFLSWQEMMILRLESTLKKFGPTRRLGWVARARILSGNKTKGEQNQSWNRQEAGSGWWFEIFFMFTPTWGNDPIWRAYFWDGWFIHQLGMLHPDSGVWRKRLWKITYPYVPGSINSHYFHIIGDGHQPNSKGLYTHYKDSY